MSGWLDENHILVGRTPNLEILDQSPDHGSWIRSSQDLSRLKDSSTRPFFRIFDLKQTYCGETQEMQAEFVRHCICLGSSNPRFTIGGTSLCCPEVGLMATEACATLILIAMLEMQRNVAPDVGVLPVVGAVHAEGA